MALIFSAVSCGGGEAGQLSSRIKPDHPLPVANNVGKEACLLCHDGKDKDFARSRHWVSEDSRTPLSTHACESCHGPGSLHAENRGSDTVAADIITFGPSSAFSARQQSAQCLQCHERDHPDWRSTKHFQNGVACTDCHAAHGAVHGEPTIGQLQLCGQCHHDKALAMERVSHHPVREGRMACTDCHDPHGTGRDANLVATSVNDLCYKCHTEKRGPHLWEHAPVVENCTTCHEPHGTIHTKLLKENLPFLCQRCHSDSRHPGTLYDRSGTFGGSAPNNRVFANACLNCHSRIHGSNHPSGHTFER